ncbi:LPS export ABC transporter permease LptG [Aquabacterium sp. J223]|uniref:LPS export ABC transporter permease LptG n=1 Tax=Aquabacterium sp. J223 TaxID=2898431 RepID=UPI0021ADD537|nr:LPS export ABC transporter permease LptG [Aquabacterium sp. J223]UUX94820.1 LPS export ABC transporter permease LptG [Aquabacterium sp. J223]
MRTVRRLLYRDILNSVVFVALAFLSLFFFIDLVDELGDIGRPGYGMVQAVLAGLLELPGHFYELFPIAVLIGSIYTLSRLAESSEFTILRTAGLAPGQALRLLAALGLVFAALTFAVGDGLAPLTERQAVQVKNAGRGVQVGGSGAWLRDRQATPEGERSYSVNVLRASADGALEQVRIYEFDDQGRLLSRLQAERARIVGAVWQLAEVRRSTWPAEAAARDDGRPAAGEERLDRLDWASGLDAGVVASAVLPLSTMSTLDLWRYTGHLSDQEQAVQPYAIRFWKKALYPFACVVMLALALPFAYLHARGGGISWRVFGGILLGISFVLLNNVAGHLGLLNRWTPWVVAATPSALYLLLSLAAFAWLVRYR